MAKKQLRAEKRQARKELKKITPRPKKALKRFGLWYYPAQYLIIHLALFGFVLEPSLMDMWAAFRVSNIVLTFFSAADLIVIAWQIGHYMAVIILALWFAIRMLWASIFLIVWLFGLGQLLMYTILSIKSSFDKANVNTNRQVTIRNGAPGDGKSWFTAYYCYMLSMLMRVKLSWLYWVNKSRVAKWEAVGNNIKLADWKEIKESYEFYKTPQDVIIGYDEAGNEIIEKRLPAWCIFSNIGFKVLGKYTCRLTKAHLMQELRLPAYTVIWCDEVGTMLDVEDGKDKPLIISDFLRWVRQFAEIIFLGTEQDSNNIYIDCRRVVTENEYMQGAKRQMKPLLLLLIFNPLKAFFVRYQFGSKMFSPFMRFLESLINSVGFVRFKYRSEGNTEHSNALQKDKTFTMRICQCFEYSTRAFRRLYKAKDKAISGVLHKYLHVEDTPQNCIDFLRSEDEPPSFEDIQDYFIQKAKKKRDFDKYIKTYPDLWADCQDTYKDDEPA